ncbi:MAG: MBL fold metallo-hydrolase [archaeon]
MFEQITKNVYGFYDDSPGSNSYLLVGKKIVFIDSGLRSNAQFLVQCLETIGLKPENIDLVLFTHGHSNHFSGSQVFSKAEPLMSEHDALLVNVKDRHFTRSDFFHTNFFPHIRRFVSHGQEFDLEQFLLRVLITPGHTKGSACYYEPRKKILFSGDTLMAEKAGRHDYLSGSRPELLASIQALSKLKIELLLPGHGKPLKENVPMGFAKVIAGLKGR